MLRIAVRIYLHSCMPLAKPEETSLPGVGDASTQNCCVFEIDARTAGLEIKCANVFYSCLMLIYTLSWKNLLQSSRVDELPLLVMVTKRGVGTRTA